MWSKFRRMWTSYSTPDCNILYLNRNLTALNTNRFFFSSVDIPSLSTRALSYPRSREVLLLLGKPLFALKSIIHYIQSPSLHIKNYNILTGSRISLSWFSCGSCSNWNWSVGLCGGRNWKLENPRKNPWSKTRTNNRINPNTPPGMNRTRAILVGASAIPDSLWRNGQVWLKQPV